jgi:NAD(P)-dependent dehydrogenase (short-subunit alcohol dehydrogenase family)
MNDPLFSLRERVVLVTGGSRGLGRAMSLAMAARGARVIVASRKLESCEALVAEIQAAQGDARALALHVGSWDELDSIVETAHAFWGRIDGLVNNAGVSPLASSLLETSQALVDKVIDVNLKGPMRLTALVANRMANGGGGSIVNISSLASVRPTPLVASYAAAKAGLNAMTVASAIEFASFGIRVNGIVCGTFETDATTGLVGDPAVHKEIAGRVALRRIGDPGEVVGAVVYLLSDASSYTTGSLLTVDGGVF